MREVLATICLIVASSPAWAQALRLSEAQRPCWA